MKESNHKLFEAVKWIVTLAAYGFLVYKLAHIEYRDELKHTLLSMNGIRIGFLLAVILIMPLNWLLETRKWQLLTSSTVTLSFRTSLKGVLAGLCTGFVTPNCFGDFAGRVFFLPDSCRLTGVLLSFINSVSQSLVVTLFGVIGAGFYVSKFYPDINYPSYLIVVLLVLVLCGSLYYAFPGLVRKIFSGKWAIKLRQAAIPVSKLSLKSLILFLIISVIRYVVLCTQFYFMLKFFGIEVSTLQALSAIPAMYLLITFTPSYAVSDAAVRGSYAVLIFGVYSANIMGITLTGILVWLINFVIPMLAGSFFVLKAKSWKSVESTSQE